MGSGGLLYSVGVSSKHAAWIYSFAVTGICVAMVIATLLSNDESVWYFHPARDPMWRGLLAQFVHVDLMHLAANVGILLLLWSGAVATGITESFMTVLFCSAVTVSFGLREELAPLTWYAGASGALYGLAAWILVRLMFRIRQMPSRLIINMAFIALGCKVILGVSPSFMDMPVAANAHVYGFATGAAYALLVVATQAYRCRRIPA